MECLFDLDSKNMNLILALISEVAKRPLLWDRYDNDYNNRAAMDHEWEKIAVLLKKDKDFVKQKWRNLRDQFQRESKKVKVPFDNPTKPYIHYYRGKWIYFEHMLFLKDVTSKKSSSYSPPDEIEIREDDIKEEIIEFDDDIFIDHVTNYNNEDENCETEQQPLSAISPSVEETPSTLEPKIEMIEEVNSGEKYEEGRKRKASEPKSESIVPMKRPSVAEVTQTEDCEIDDDLHFVKSLVPYLKKLSPIRKLLVRNEIQSLLIRESLCDKCKFGHSSTHNT